MSLGAGARKIGRAIQAAVGHGGGTLYLLYRSKLNLG